MKQFDGTELGKGSLSLRQEEDVNILMEQSWGRVFL